MAVRCASPPFCPPPFICCTSPAKQGHGVLQKPCLESTERNIKSSQQAIVSSLRKLELMDESTTKCFVVEKNIDQSTAMLLMNGSRLLVALSSKFFPV